MFRSSVPLSRKAKNLFKRVLAAILIFNHLLIYSPQATANSAADLRHFSDVFGEELAPHIARKCVNLPVIDVSVSKNQQGAYSLVVIPISKDSETHAPVSQNENGVYSLEHELFQTPGIINFRDQDEIVGTWVVDDKKQAYLKGVKGATHSFEISSPLTMSSLNVQIGGDLRFLREVILEQGASIESRSLGIGNLFSSQGKTQFIVQDKVDVLQNARLESIQGIVGKFKSFLNKGSVKSQEDILFEVGDEFANNGTLTIGKKLILKGKTLLNRSKIAAETLFIETQGMFQNFTSSIVEVARDCTAMYGAFKNSGTMKIMGSFFSKGKVFGKTLDEFNEKKTSSSRDGILEVGELYQVQVDEYIGSGLNRWKGLATLTTGSADLAGSYTFSSALIEARTALTARAESSFQLSHFLALKSSNGTLDFGGNLSLHSSLPKLVYPKNSSQALLMAKLPKDPLISMEGCKAFTQRGNIQSDSSSILYSSKEGKFHFTGNSRSGFFKDNVTEIRAHHANLEGQITSFGDVVFRVQESLRIAGGVVADNLKAFAKELFVSGSVTTEKDAYLEIRDRAAIAKTGVLEIGKNLALISEGDVSLNGLVHANRSLVQANTITNTGSFSVDEFAHFKADTFFANLWGGSVKGKDVQIDAGLVLNFFGTLSATRGLTTNALVDFNLGLKTAHHITTSSLFSIDAGLSLPFLHLSDLLSWESAWKGLKATALAFSPSNVRSLINLGVAAWTIFQQASRFYDNYSSLGDKTRFSDIIPLLVGIRDLAFSTYTIAQNAGALSFQEIPQEIKKVANTIVTPNITQESVTTAVVSTASMFMPSFTQDSLFSINTGFIGSGNVYQRGMSSTNYGVLGAGTYTNDSLNANSNGYVIGHRINYSNTHFQQKGHIFAFGDVNASAGNLHTDEGSTTKGANVAFFGNRVTYNGKVSSTTHTQIRAKENLTTGARSSLAGKSVVVQGENVVHHGAVKAEDKAVMVAMKKLETSTSSSATGGVAILEAQDLILSGSLRTVEEAAIRAEKTAEITETGSANIGRNLSLESQGNVKIAGFATTGQQAVIKGKEEINITQISSLKSAGTLILESQGDIIHDGNNTHAKNVVAQGNTITNSGHMSVDERAHLKADTYFANLWGAGIDAQDIQIDTGINLNIGRLSATRSLTTNALVDLNLLGIQTAHHHTSSSLFSLNAGLYLPSLTPSGLFSWESLYKGGWATAMACSPSGLRNVLNLGRTAYTLYTQSSALYERYQSGENVRFSDMIPLVVSLKDLGGFLYTTTHTMEDPAVQENSLLEPIPTLLWNAGGAAANVFLPSITQDSLFSINAGFMGSGNIYQRGVSSINYGILGAGTYTNDFLTSNNKGYVIGNKINYSSTHFYNTGNIHGLSIGNKGGNINIKATGGGQNTGLIEVVGNNGKLTIQGAMNSGTVTASGFKSQVNVDHNSGKVTAAGDKSHAFAKENTGEVSSFGIESQVQALENSGLVLSSGARSRASADLNSGKVTAAGDGSSALSQINTGEITSFGVKSHVSVDHNSGKVEAEGEKSLAFVKENTKTGSVVSTGTESQAHADINSGEVSSTGLKSTAFAKENTETGVVSSFGVESQASVEDLNAGKITSTGDKSIALANGGNAGTVSSSGTESQAIANNKNTGTISSSGNKSQAGVVGDERAYNLGTVSSIGEKSRAFIQAKIDAENSGTLSSSGAESHASLVGMEGSSKNAGIVSSTGDKSNIFIKGKREVKITQTSSLKSEGTLALESEGEIIHEGRNTHAKKLVAQANTITNSGHITVDEKAHLKADMYFANLWGAGIDAQDIQIDTSINLNMGRLSATRSLTTNALVDLNLLGIQTAHHHTSSSLFSLNAGLYLPSLTPSGLFSWESLYKGGWAAAMACSPSGLRNAVNLGFAVWNIYTKAPELYERYQSGENVRFSDMIPLIVGLKDLGGALYTTAHTIGDSSLQENPLLEPTPTLLWNAGGAAANVFLPSITQDSLFSINAGFMGSGNIYQRGVSSINYGILGAGTYTNDFLNVNNAGYVGGHHVRYANTHFDNSGNIYGLQLGSQGGNINIKATGGGQNTGLIEVLGNKSTLTLQGATNAGLASAFGVESKISVDRNSGHILAAGDRSRAFAKENTGEVSSFGIESQALALENSGLIFSSGARSRASADLNSGKVTAAGDGGSALSQTNTGEITSFGIESQALALENSGLIFSSGARSRASADLNSGKVTAAGDGGSALSQTNTGEITSFGIESQALALENSGLILSNGARSRASADLNNGKVTAAGDGSSALSQTNTGEITSFGIESQALALENSGLIFSSGARSRASADLNNGKVTAAGDESIAFSHINTGEITSFGVKSHVSVDHNNGKVEVGGEKSLAFVKENSETGKVVGAGAGTQASVDLNNGKVKVEGEKSLAFVKENTKTGSVVSTGTESQVHADINSGEVSSTGLKSTAFAKENTETGVVSSFGVESQASVQEVNKGKVTSTGDQSLALAKGGNSGTVSSSGTGSQAIAKDKNTGTVSSLGNKSQAGVIGNEWAHNTGTVTSVGDHSSVFVQGKTDAENSGILSSSGIEGYASVVAMDGNAKNSGTVSSAGDRSSTSINGKTAENSGRVDASGNETIVRVYGSDKTTLTETSVTQGHVVLIGKEYSQDFASDGTSVLNATRSKETDIVQGAQVNATNTEIAGDKLTSSVTISALHGNQPNAVSFESDNGKLSNVNQIHASEAYVSSGKLKGGAQEAIDTANHMTNTQKVIWNASQDDFVNNRAQTIQVKDRAFIFKSVDNSARLDAEGKLYMDGIDRFRTTADIHAETGLATVSSQGKHKTLNGAVQSTTHGLLHVEGAEGLVLESVIKPNGELKRGGYVGNSVNRVSGGDFENTAGQTIARSGDIKSEIQGNQHEHALQCTHGTRSLNVDGSRETLQGGHKAKEKYKKGTQTFARVEDRATGRIEEEIRGKLIAEASLRSATQGGFTLAHQGIEAKTLHTTYLSDKGKEKKLGGLWGKEKWEDQATDFYRSEWNSRQGAFDVLAPEGHCDLRAILFDVKNKSTIYGRDGVDLGAVIAQNHYKSSDSSWFHLSKDKSKGYQDVGEVCEVIGREKIIIGSAGMVTGKGVRIIAPSISIHGEKGIALNGLPLRSYQKMSSIRPVVSLLGVDVIAPREEMPLLKPEVSVGFKTTRSQTHMSWEQQGFIQTDHLEVSTGQGYQTNLQGLNLVGLSDPKISYMSSDTDILLLGGTNYTISSKQNSFKETQGMAWAGAFVPTASASYSKAKDTVDGVDPTQVQIAQFDNKRSETEIHISNGIQGGIGSTSGNPINLTVDHTQTVHRQSSHSASFGVSGDVISLAGGFNKGTVKSSEGTHFDTPSTINRTDICHHDTDTRRGFSASLAFSSQAPDLFHTVQGGSISGQVRGQTFMLDSSMITNFTNPSAGSSGNMFDSTQNLIGQATAVTTMTSNIISAAALGGADVENLQQGLGYTSYALGNAKGLTHIGQAAEYTMKEKLSPLPTSSIIQQTSDETKDREEENTLSPLSSLMPVDENLPSLVSEIDNEDPILVQKIGTTGAHTAHSMTNPKSEEWMDFPEILSLKETGQWDKLSEFQKIEFESMLMDHAMNRAELQGYSDMVGSVWRGVKSVGSTLRDAYIEGMRSEMPQVYEFTPEYQQAEADAVRSLFQRESYIALGFVGMKGLNGAIDTLDTAFPKTMMYTRDTLNNISELGDGVGYATATLIGAGVGGGVLSLPGAAAGAASYGLLKEGWGAANTIADQGVHRWIEGSQFTPEGRQEIHAEFDKFRRNLEFVSQARGAAKQIHSPQGMPSHLSDPVQAQNLDRSREIYKLAK